VGFAQTPTTSSKPPATAQTAKPDPYADLPEEYIEEAEKFYNECQTNDNMSRYYNCECLASKFLDKRIMAGPEVLNDIIVQSITHECADAAGAAGQEYQSCLENAPMMPANIPIEEYCTCYANTYAKLYEKYSLGPSSNTFIKLQTEAHISCQNPDLAKRLYPYKPPAKKSQ
jgi:hypothetical protein